MQFVVSVEPSHGRGFLARSPFVPEVTAEAPTADQAVAQLRRQLTNLAVRGELRLIDVPIPTADREPLQNPWQKIAGIYKDEPLFEEVFEHMKAYREQRNREMDEVSE
jgi:hypothetical protein